MTNCKQYDQRKREKKSHEEKRKNTGWVDKFRARRMPMVFLRRCRAQGWVDKSRKHGLTKETEASFSRLPRSYR